MKCKICGKEILRDSQCINYKYYHNDCIENLEKQNKQLKDKIPYIIQNNSCKYISIEKCKNKVCVNYKMQELQESDSNVKEKDFFKTCFNTVAGLEVTNESQAIAKEVVLSEVEQLQQDNKKLKERIEYLERSNNRREDTILEQRQEISNLEDNWNKLKKYIKTEIPEDAFIDTEWFVSILDKMQELEGSNV